MYTTFATTSSTVLPSRSARDEARKSRQLAGTYAYSELPEEEDAEAAAEGEEEKEEEKEQGD